MMFNANYSISKIQVSLDPNSGCSLMVRPIGPTTLSGSDVVYDPLAQSSFDMERFKCFGHRGSAVVQIGQCLTCYFSATSVCNQIK